MLNIISLILVIIGGLNWGLVGFLQWDLVAALFGGGDATAMLPRIIYGLVGLAALYMLVTIGNWLKK
ncbi:MAG: DUF378 domain-containing protein [Patescibacteria group bacterium]|jgi:hypothetical protein